MAEQTSTPQTSTIHTLTDFLTASGVQWRVHDLSRRVISLSPTLIQEVEQGLRPFPHPRQQKAWLAISFWQANAAVIPHPYIWFVALPLDERGCFQQAAMQDFMSIVVAALEQDHEHNSEKNHNPYIFQPDENRRAAFHAQMSSLLQQPPSIHFETAEAYFLEHGQQLAWQQLGVQGIHDVLVRGLEQSKLQEKITQNFFSYPAPVREALCQALEQTQLPAAFFQQLFALTQQHHSVQNQLLLLRSLSSGAAEPAFQAWLTGLLQASADFSAPQQEELLLIIAARCWPALQQANLLEYYFTLVVEYNPQLFPALYKELVALACLRPLCLAFLHKPHQTPLLQQAIADLTRSLYEPNHV